LEDSLWPLGFITLVIEPGLVYSAMERFLRVSRGKGLVDGVLGCVSMALRYGLVEDTICNGKDSLSTASLYSAATASRSCMIRVVVENVLALRAAVIESKFASFGRQTRVRAIRYLIGTA